jgi:hypothetical protein
LKKLAAALVLGCALLATSAAFAATGRTGAGASSLAAPALNWGVADDASKYADDGGSWFYGQLHGANLTENRWTVTWDPNNPTTIGDLAFLQRAAPQAQAAGIHVVLALYGRPATANDPTAFCAWAATVAATAKVWGIHDFIVWNEPNTALFWSPQDAGAPAKYEALLAQCYDTIHAADSDAQVIGFGLSPRSNGPSQTAPLPFLAGVGAAYRASGRQTPIMDQLSIHPYPNPNSPTDSPDVGYTVKANFGVSNLDRVKQAVYDAFNGTGQPTTLNGLTFRIDELGWQTDTTKYSQYFNQENVKVISEQQQADYFKTTAEKWFACDPTVTDVELFLLVDEATRNGRSQDGSTVLGGGWQSGLLTAGGQGVSQPKAAYSQLASDFGAGRGACKGAMVNWTPNGTQGGGTVKAGKSGGKSHGKSGGKSGGKSHGKSSGKSGGKSGGKSHGKSGKKSH